MHCPFCSSEETKVIDSRLAGEGTQVRRRRECNHCGERFTTYETAELVMPRIVKGDGKREPYDETKLRRGLELALEKRPVSVDEMEAAINRIAHRLRTAGEREVASRQIGGWVMDELRDIDQVAFVRFASVYRSFQELDEFQREIERLKSQLAANARDQMSLLEPDED